MLEFGSVVRCHNVTLVADLGRSVNSCSAEVAASAWCCSKAVQSELLQLNLVTQLHAAVGPCKQSGFHFM